MVAGPRNHLYRSQIFIPFRSETGKVCDPRMQGMPMRRREFITLLCGMATAWPLEARAQRPRKFPFVGVLVSASHPHPFADAFWRGLHALGYSDGENIKVEIRYTDGRSDRAKEYAERACPTQPRCHRCALCAIGFGRRGSHANDPD